MNMEGTSQSQDIYQKIIVLIDDFNYTIDDLLQKAMQA